MCNTIYLTKMTRTIAEQYFKDFTIDPAVFLDNQTIYEFKYSSNWLTEYLGRYTNCEHLAVMLQNEPIGEILFKRINYTDRSAVFSIHLKNDSVKGKGYGTQAQRMALQYAFNILKLNTIYADAVKKNHRSIHVLEMVGFRFLKEDNDFAYYVIHRPEA